VAGVLNRVGLRARMALDLSVLVLPACTGHDAPSQAKHFTAVQGKAGWASFPCRATKRNMSHPTAPENGGQPLELDRDLVGWQDEIDVS
jgi:hypothetical protein